MRKNTCLLFLHSLFMASILLAFNEHSNMLPDGTRVTCYRGPGNKIYTNFVYPDGTTKEDCCEDLASIPPTQCYYVEKPNFGYDFGTKAPRDKFELEFIANMKRMKRPVFFNIPFATPEQSSDQFPVNELKIILYPKDILFENPSDNEKSGFNE